MSAPIPYLVVDASVSLKWALNDEEAVDQAIALRDAAILGQFEMIAPSLWLYEVANGLVTAVRRARLAPEDGAHMLALLQSLGMHLVAPSSTDVFQQSLRHGITAYDASYIALAEALEAPLWTGDQRFYNAVHDATNVIHWIGDYSEP